MQDSRGCNVEQRVFEAMAERKFPRLLEVFDRLECSMGRLTEEWFKCLFVTVLPAETTARVWDCMFVEGPKVLHRVALSLLKVGCRLLRFSWASACLLLLLQLSCVQCGGSCGHLQHVSSQSSPGGCLVCSFVCWMDQATLQCFWEDACTIAVARAVTVRPPCYR